jgi:hypothetical protein
MQRSLLRILCHMRMGNALQCSGTVTMPLGHVTLHLGEFEA